MHAFFCLGSMVNFTFLFSFGLLEIDDDPSIKKVVGVLLRAVGSAILAEVKTHTCTCFSGVFSMPPYSCSVDNIGTYFLNLNEVA
jgi:hypothetical protein